MNDTMTKFGYPSSLIREYSHWAVLVRPKQVTLGSLVLVAKGEATAWPALTPEAFAELRLVTDQIEQVLRNGMGCEKVNYLMLMMPRCSTAGRSTRRCWQHSKRTDWPFENFS